MFYTYIKTNNSKCTRLLKSIKNNSVDKLFDIYKTGKEIIPFSKLRLCIEKDVFLIKQNKWILGFSILNNSI